MKRVTIVDGVIVNEEIIEVTVDTNASHNAEVAENIAMLEMEITPRRLREHALGEEELVDGVPFLRHIDNLIKEERARFL